MRGKLTSWIVSLALSASALAQGLSLRGPVFVAQAGQNNALVGGGYTDYAATFDGATCLVKAADLTGNADSSVGTFSCWFNISSGDATLRYIYSSAGTVNTVTLSGGNKVQISLQNSVPTVLINLISTTTVVAGSGWHHLMASWDANTTTKRHLYIDNVNVLTAGSNVAGTIKWTQASHVVGRKGSSGNYWLGCLSEVYLDVAHYTDLSVAGNRTVFYGTGHPPGSLAAVGPPIVYLANPFGTFQTDLGTGGNFVVTGNTLTSCTAP